jgi:signal transduction histidine kinase
MPTRDDISLAGLAHDLNNVFQTLVGVAMQLENEPELAAAILRCVERGQNIAAGLASDSQVLTPFSTIVANATDFVRDFQAATCAPKTTVTSEIEPGIEFPNHGAWERVLINLFLNSVRAMPHGGSIHVVAKHIAGGLQIRVADEGSGIPQELLDRLFEPHVSGNGSTGLGLSIVQSIIRAHNGRVEASNREGASGAEFVITLRTTPKVKSARSGR